MLNKFRRLVSKFPMLNFYICSGLIALALSNFYSIDSAQLMLQIIGVVALIQIAIEIRNTMKHGFFGIKLLPAVGIIATILLDHPWTALLLAIAASLDKPLIALADRKKSNSNRASSFINIQHAPFIQTLDRYSVSFIIFILLGAGSVWLTTGESTRFLQIIAIASTTPLLLAPVLSYMRAIVVSNRRGVAFVSASAFEKFAQTASLLIYTRGALIKENPEVLAIKFFGKHTKEEVLQTAATLAVQSQHPLAIAIAQKAGQTNAALKAKHAKEVPNLGISGRVRGEDLHIGRLSYLESLDVDTQVKFTEPAETVVYVARNKQLIGYITFKEAVIENSTNLAKELKKSKVVSTLVSGSTAKSIGPLARKLGFTNFRGDITPGEIINLLETNENRPIAVIGNPETDGVALAAADVAISTHGHVNGLTAVTFSEYSPSVFVNALRVSKRGVIRAKISGLGGMAIVLLLAVVAATGIGTPEYWAIGQILFTLLIGIYAVSIKTK